MIKVVSVAQIRRIEAASDAAGHSYAAMMQRAGEAVAQRARTVLAGTTEPRVTVLVGAGNNGGDGLVAGTALAESSTALVRFYLAKRRPDDDPIFAPVRRAGLFVATAEDDQRYRVLENMIASADLIIDALFGIGIQLPLRPDAAKLLRVVHTALQDTFPSPPLEIVDFKTTPSPLRRPYVIAVDCPSGLDCDTGEHAPHTIPADETLTFIAAKPGLLTFPGAALVGDLRCAAAGVSQSLPELHEQPDIVIDAAAASALLPPRPLDGHKGTFGRVVIAAGSASYVGAAGLAALAAYRAGAGLVSVAAPTAVVTALSGNILEATWLPLRHHADMITPESADIVRQEALNAQAVLLGPGLGLDPATQAFVDALLTHLTNDQAPDSGNDQQTAVPPLIIDADGLNHLAKLDHWWLRLPKNTILTPHPGEMGRLCNLPTHDVQSHRWSLAREHAANWNAVVVLKGAHTLVAAPDGRVGVLPFKTSALAKAGTGDVLAGIIAGMAAQGLKPFDAAVCGAYLHGASGLLAARAASSRSLLARDLLDHLAEAFSQLTA